MQKIYYALFVFSISCLNINAQDRLMNLSKDSSTISPGKFVEVKIMSKTDNHIQPAIFFRSTSIEKKPLIIKLHSWSGDFKKIDPLSNKIKELDWNYIHPNFRGPNNTPEACGSSLVISDIEDAIDFAIKNANVDDDQIHIIGGSGGGYATLLCYMKIKYNINSFSAWNPITNLVDWYYESLGRGNLYSKDIFKATSSIETLNKEEAMRRSPVFMDYLKVRDKAKLFIYHGIHDGYEGPVPITHSLNFYNELIRKIDPEEKEASISEKDILDLLIKRCLPESISSNEMIGDRKIHYRKNYRNVQLIIFEGKHDWPNQVALDLIPVKN